jgi:SET domain-containing protein
MPPRRVAVRRSTIHGRGVFAAARIAAGEDILDYRGTVRSWQDAVRDYHDSDAEHGHTFFFDLGDGQVIDGGLGGNSARWINHGCDPNCEGVRTGDRIVIHARRDIEPGEELLLDYRLQLEDDADAEAREMYACRCSASSCRRTMLAAG